MPEETHTTSGSTLRCPFAAFLRLRPPTHLMDSADWVRLVLRASSTVPPRWSARPLSGPGRLTEIGCDVALQRHAQIQECAKPSGRFQGHRKQSVGKTVGNGRRGGSGSIERIAIRGRRDELGLDGASPVPRADAGGFFPHSRA